MTTSEEFGLIPELQPSKKTEVTRLRDNFEEFSRVLGVSRELLKTARIMRSRGSDTVMARDYMWIFKKQQEGESIDDIEAKYAEEVRVIYERTMEAELSYQEANVAMLRGEGYTPGTDEDVLRVIDGLEKSSTIGIDPVRIEIYRRQMAGESMSEIRAKAVESINTRSRAARFLRRAEAMKNPNQDILLDYETDMMILERIKMGESIDDIIDKSRAELDKYDQDNQKRRELAESLARYDELKGIQKKINSSK